MSEQHRQIPVITAQSADSALPTVGPWFLSCSDCGALGVALTALAADRALIAHAQRPHVTVGAGQ